MREVLVIGTGRLYEEPELGEPFTPRQREVAALVAQALTNEEIAAAIGRSLKTVEKQIHCCYLKAGARNRVALVLWWQTNGAAA